MRKFETLLLLSPELSADQREAMLSGFVGVIEREQGTMAATDHWGMRDLAYPVNKHMRGYYVRLEYTAPNALIAELERNIRIAEGVYRFITVRLADNAEEEAA
jgi:small subunit ribosomal protein S6